MNITALHGTVALVTGASSGIGDATARRLEDIADGITYLVTRPRRSSVGELWAMPTSQA